jgi:hypothetical protein
MIIIPVVVILLLALFTFMVTSWSYFLQDDNILKGLSSQGIFQVVLLCLSIVFTYTGIITFVLK